MAASQLIYIGIRGAVVALNRATGDQLWVRRLKGTEFVNVVLDGNQIYAATHGEIYCLDRESGIVLWHNPLKGYGWGLASIAGQGIPQNTSLLAEEKRRRDQQAAAATAS